MKASDLTRLWSGYEINTHTGEHTGKSTSDSYIDQLNKLLSVQTSPADRRAAYSAIQRISPLLKDRAQEVINLNFENMQPLEGRIKDMSDSATRLIKRLAIVGMGLAVVLILFMSRAILRPLEALTRSLQEIAEGNLDQVVQVKSRDELRKLAEAFNSMAAKLREFRRTDRAKLVRIAAHHPARRRQPARRRRGREFHGRRRDFQRNRAEALPALSRTVGAVAPRPPVGRVVSAGRPRRRRPSQPKGYESAIEVYDQGGQLRFFLPRAIPILDADRHLLGVTLVLGDVTNLRRLDEMKSGLLSVVSHELKTPLTSIRMASHLLAGGARRPAEPQANRIADGGPRGCGPASEDHRGSSGHGPPRIRPRQAGSCNPSRPSDWCPTR